MKLTPLQAIFLFKFKPVKKTIIVSRFEKYNDSFIVGFTVQNKNNNKEYFETLVDSNCENKNKAGYSILKNNIKEFMNK